MQAEEAIIHKVDQTIILRTAQGAKHIKQAERSVTERKHWTVYTVFLNAVWMCLNFILYWNTHTSLLESCQLSIIKTVDEMNVRRF